MVTYECKLCSYLTNDQSNFIKHKKSAKHTKKEEQYKNSTNKIQNDSNKNPNLDCKYTCEYCEKDYTTSSNLSKHKKICKDKRNLINKLENEKTNQENIYLKEMVKKLEEDKIKLEEDKRQLNDNVEHYKKVINNAGLIIKTSVSSLSYVVKNYPNAPKLEKLKDYSYIKYKDEDDEFDLIDIIFSQYENKKLHEYLGNIIINAYKKEDPSTQSFWTSDISRLTYIIRDIINKNTEWSVDKGGIKMTKYVIKPLIEYIWKLLNEYIESHQNCKYVYKPLTEFTKIVNNMDKYKGIIKDIKNNVLTQMIIKYIAPYFQITKQVILIGKDDNLIDE